MSRLNNVEPPRCETPSKLPSVLSHNPTAGSAWPSNHTAPAHARGCTVAASSHPCHPPPPNSFFVQKMTSGLRGAAFVRKSGPPHFSSAAAGCHCLNAKHAETRNQTNLLLRRDRSRRRNTRALGRRERREVPRRRRRMASSRVRSQSFTWWRRTKERLCSSLVCVD